MSGDLLGYIDLAKAIVRNTLLDKDYEAIETPHFEMVANLAGFDIREVRAMTKNTSAQHLTIDMIKEARESLIFPSVLYKYNRRWGNKFRKTITKPDIKFILDVIRQSKLSGQRNSKQLTYLVYQHPDNKLGIEAIKYVISEFKLSKIPLD